MKIIAVTQQGVNKQENEDRLVVGNTVVSQGTYCVDFSSGILAVADGVGGNNAGAVASQFVADSLAGARQVSLEQMQQINDQLIQNSYSNPLYSGMATTLSGVYLSAEGNQIFSVGNTRVYLLQGGCLKQLTTDDTLLNRLLASGQLSPQEVENFDRKNVITACFGGGNADYFKLKLGSLEGTPSTLVLTSDGIHDHLLVDQMEDILQQFGLTEQACMQLINCARENGSTDDVSVMLAFCDQVN